MIIHGGKILQEKEMGCLGVGDNSESVMFGCLKMSENYDLRERESGNGNGDGKTW